ncbi:DUF2523 family protein [Acinetobacter radioresistens]|uniref:DUF2523 family protein n=1 Tax=Acinetobacter radioresistens TaxID=40216 RepID=UPI002005202F|nr:DUF2523 family protein [Acinetobacter radioresistens]MCK4109421.1 DUF2523 domain-containing protein [Acinetobacter radioresistens]
MPAVLITVFTLLARYLIARLLVGAGLTVITFTVINSYVNQLKDMLQGYLYNLPSNLFYIIDLTNFDFYVSTVISAYSLAISIKSAKVFIGKA